MVNGLSRIADSSWFYQHSLTLCDSGENRTEISETVRQYEEIHGWHCELILLNINFRVRFVKATGGHILPVVQFLRKCNYFRDS
jgi:hypothetical protein